MIYPLSIDTPLYFSKSMNHGLLQADEGTEFILERTLIWPGEKRNIFN